jgi:hypothetical protein
MDFFAALLLILLLVAIAIGIVYFLKDYYDYRTNTDSHLSNVDTGLSNTSSLGNLKYVVDQANTSFNQIGSTLYGFSNSTNTSLNSLTTQQRTLGSNLNDFKNNFNSAFRFSTVIEDPLTAQPNTHDVFNFPGVGTIDTRLINHVTAVGGFTARDLTTSGNNQVKICGTGAGSKCIRFPDNDGNTYLTALNPTPVGGVTPSVILDGNVSIGNGTGNLLVNVPTNSTPVRVQINGTDVFAINKNGDVAIKGDIVSKSQAIPTTFYQ